MIRTVRQPQCGVVILQVQAHTRVFAVRGRRRVFAKGAHGDRALVDDVGGAGDEGRAAGSNRVAAGEGRLGQARAIGAGIGRLVGEALRTLTTSVTGECPLSPAGGYAIVGAAAFSARRRGNLISRDAIDAMSAQA